MQSRKGNEGRVVIDMDAVFSFVFVKEDRDVDTNLEETYGFDDEKHDTVLLSKTTRENKSSDHSQHEIVRYEFVKNLLAYFDDIEFNEDTGEPEIVTLSQEIAWNTLFQYGFIKRV